jgi:hypothetical protein
LAKKTATLRVGGFFMSNRCGAVFACFELRKWNFGLDITAITTVQNPTAAWYSGISR